MKKFACEMCDSGDLIKEGDYYVCQNCGTKYTLEAAKKLMIEGTVQIDRSIDISNLYTLARRARETNNIESARKYYEQLVQLDPNNWEAYFFSVYYQQLDCKIYQIASAASNIKNTIEPTVRMIESLSNSSEKADAYNVLAESVLSAEKTLYFSALKHYNNNSNANGAFNELNERERACADLIKQCASLLKSTDYGKKPAFKLYEYLQSNNRLPSNIDKEKIWQYMHECDPSFDANSRVENKSNGGCYVATAVYGCYDCPEVWTLRRYRDYTLAKTWYGRAFIHLYYAISPTIVRYFGHTEWFRKMWKGRLDSMVCDLRKRGFSDTPYNDRSWK